MDAMKSESWHTGWLKIFDHSSALGVRHENMGQASRAAGPALRPAKEAGGTQRASTAPDPATASGED